MKWAMWLAVLAGLLLAGIGKADTYWIAWEGDDWPENQGWTRCFYPPGATRTLLDGVLTYDTIWNDWRYWDGFERFRPGALDAQEDGETFVCEWYLHVEAVAGWETDPSLGICSDEAWVVAFSFGVDHVESIHEYVTFDVGAGPHAYRLTSADMLTYKLYVDSVLLREGSFAHRYTQSRISWGDGSQGSASLAHWDYLGFGVILAAQAGDLNCDGTVDFADINPFVQVLTDPNGYQNAYPGCWPENADINGDGDVDFGDINPFVALLSS